MRTAAVVLKTCVLVTNCRLGNSSLSLPLHKPTMTGSTLRGDINIYCKLAFTGLSQQLYDKTPTTLKGEKGGEINL